MMMMNSLRTETCKVKDYYFFKLHRAEEEPISFEEAFGRPPEEAFDGRPNPGEGPGGVFDEPPADEQPPPTPADEQPTPGGSAPETPAAPAGGGAGAAELAAWQQEMVGRGFAPDAFGEAGWATYRNLEQRFSQRPPEAPSEPEEEEYTPPVPLGVQEIRTEEDLYASAQVRPRETYIWAMNQPEGTLSQEQMDQVANTWFVTNPAEYHRWHMAMMMEGMRGEVQQTFQHETRSQIDSARSQGLQEAYDDEIVGPLLQQYRPQLGQYMADHPHLNEWVNSLRTAREVKSAVEAVFFMFAGPELAREVMSARAAAEVGAGTPASEEGEGLPVEEPPDPASAVTPRRSAAPRSGAVAPRADGDFAKNLQDSILNAGGGLRRDPETGRFLTKS